jgi:hypothetical protein
MVDLGEDLGTVEAQRVVAQLHREAEAVQDRGRRRVDDYQSGVLDVGPLEGQEEERLVLLEGPAQRGPFLLLVVGSLLLR